MPARILITIPVFNNGPTLECVARSVMDSGYDLLVVNDGSTDSTREVIEKLGIRHLEIPSNMGKGAAIKSAAKWALDHSYTHIITIDADGQHSPSDLPQFVKFITEHPDAVIIGARNFRQTEVPLLSRIGRWLSNLSISVLSGIRIRDSQSGFRAYPVELLTVSGCLSDRYDFEYEILLKAAIGKQKIMSIDINVIYSKQSRRGSHFRVLADNWRIIKVFLASCIYRSGCSSCSRH